MVLYNYKYDSVLNTTLARDYYIDLDEVLWDSKRFRGLEK